MFKQPLNEANVPAWAIEEQPALTFDGVPRQYRFDGEVGEFLVGEIGAGKAISIQLFNRRLVTGERWGRPNQTWIDLAFVDEQGVVGVMALKKESAINLIETFTSDLRLTSHSRLHPSAVRLGLRAVEREGEDGTYWVVEVSDWELVTQAEFDQVRHFAESGEFRWVFLGEAGV
jgi:hypothetical protein